MKKLFIIFFTILTFQSAFAQQKISAADLKLLRQKEDSLKIFAKTFLTTSETADRMRNDSLFIKTLIRSLQLKNSFYYPFDSLKGVSHLYAPDSTFRIFTWQLDFQNEYAYSRQRGAIQFRTADGSLKLIPLKDYSEFADDPLDSTRNRNTWIGAVYYNIIKTEASGRNYYTLFGFDGNSYRTNKKWMDVLTFDAQGQPVFGGQRFFSFEKDSIRRKAQYRYAMEYKKEAAATMRYDEDQKIILVDHLISETSEPESPWTFVPDGDYEGFTWVAGKWQHIDKVFDFKLKEGEAPVPDAIRDNEGNADEQKLSERSRKNMGETGEEKPAPQKTTPKKPGKKG